MYFVIFKSHNFWRDRPSTQGRQAFLGSNTVFSWLLKLRKDELKTTSGFSLSGFQCFEIKGQEKKSPKFPINSGRGCTTCNVISDPVENCQETA